MPDADEEDATIRTYDTYAQSWADEHSDPSEYRSVVAKLKSLLPAGTILEIGAGGGRDAELLVAAGYGYVGTDASAGMVRAAQKSYPALRFEPLSVYDVAKLPQRFDGFWACAVLLHVPKARIDEALQSLAAALKDDAVGFISMKDGDKQEFEQRRKASRQEDRLFAYWRKDEFEQALARNGFEVLEYRYLPKSERTKWHWFIVRKRAITANPKPTSQAEA